MSVGHCFRTLSLCILAAGTVVHAALIYTTVSQDSLTVGDRVNLQVAMVVAKGALVTPPATDEGFGDFVVKDWVMGKQERSNADSISFSYVLTTYAVQPCSIPELHFLVAQGSTVDTLKSLVMHMKVGSILPADTVDIKDIRPQQRAGKPSYLWLWLLIGGVLAAIAIILLRRRLLGRVRPVVEPPPLPPYEEALAALAALEARKHLSQGLVREYVFALSDIFKRYIGRRFENNAAEYTTEEMLGWIRGSILERAIKTSAEWFFSTTDPVKFAKVIPTDDITARLAAEVRGFLEATKPLPLAAQKTEPTNAPAQS